MRYTYVRQHDTTDCAAACLAMVCLHYKKEITITRLRDMMGTDLKGTNLTGMEKAAQELGFSTAAVRVDRENFLSEFTTPCIAQVITDEGLAHFVTSSKRPPSKMTASGVGICSGRKRSARSALTKERSSNAATTSSSATRQKS